MADLVYRISAKPTRLRDAAWRRLKGPGRRVPARFGGPRFTRRRSSSFEVAAMRFPAGRFAARHCSRRGRADAVPGRAAGSAARRMRGAAPARAAVQEERSAAPALVPGNVRVRTAARRRRRRCPAYGDRIPVVRTQRRARSGTGTPTRRHAGLLKQFTARARHEALAPRAQFPWQHPVIRPVTCAVDQQDSMPVHHQDGTPDVGGICHDKSSFPGPGKQDPSAFEPNFIPVGKVTDHA